MPVRSSGCAICRKRKIRCDENRPGCHRCATHGVSCPGYRTAKVGGLEFKDQTDITVQRAKEKYRAKALDFSSFWTTTSSDSPFSATPNSLHSGTTNGLELVPIDEGFHGRRSPNYFDGPGGMGVPSPIQILSPGAERNQLYNEFITTYLPKIQGGAQSGHFSFFQMITLKRSDQPALQEGLDALSLVQVGSINKSKSLLKAAVRQYSKALSSLARSISKGDFLYDDDVLAAVTVLATCELYEEIQSCGEGWQRHVQGSNQLVAARGPDSLQSDLALLLYSNMRHGALLYALIERKAPFMATKEWRDVAFRVPNAARDASTLFYDIALQIPGLLERHDSIDVDIPTSLEEIDSLLTESAKLEDDMRTWFTDWQAQGLLDGQIMYVLRPIDNFPTFTSLCTDRGFDHAYMFPDFLVAYLHSLYWMIMSYLRANIQSLHKLRHQVELDWYPAPNDVVPEGEVMGFILNLCRCFPFFVEPISSSTGHIGIFLPLRAAAMYFTEHGHWQYLKWIGAVKNNVFVKGLSPPNVKHNRCQRTSSLSPEQMSSPDP